jgi:hypothetical protein
MVRILQPVEDRERKEEKKARRRYRSSSYALIKISNLSFINIDEKGTPRKEKDVMDIVVFSRWGI